VRGAVSLSSLKTNVSAGVSETYEGNNFERGPTYQNRHDGLGEHVKDKIFHGHLCVSSM
jgi:hypothetical protein